MKRVMEILRKKTSSRPNDHRGDQAVRGLLLAAAVFVYLAMVAGNIVRVSGAAFGCPDWPTCYGQWGLPDGLSAQVQYAHRALILLAGLLTAGSVAVAARQRSGSWILGPAVAALLLIGLDSLLGAGSVLFPGQFDGLRAMHLGLALGAFGMILVAVLAAYYQFQDPARELRFRFRSPYARLALLTLGATFLVFVSGMAVTSSLPASSCGGWPLCNGRLVPQNLAEGLQLFHRLVTGLASVFMIGLFLNAWRSQRTQVVILPAVSTAVVLFFGQVLLGAVKVSRGFPLDLVGLHAASAAAVWAALVILVAAVGFVGRTAQDEQLEASQPVLFRQRAKDLLILTKPIIVALLLVTTYAGMVLGGKGIPSLSLTFWTLLAGAMAAGGSGAVNQFIDRELDGRMQRTAKRPLAAGRMSPPEGLAFGLLLLFGSFFLMASFVNLLAALLSLAGMIYYVLLYSILLKKATVHNIVIGGGAGAIPPLVGWAAASGSLGIPALFLFAIVFLWTPPHFWALALVRRNEYARAGIPMLPVVRGEHATRVQILVYTLELVGLTLLMPLLKITGSVFLISAAVLGAGLVYQAVKVLRKGGNKPAWMMYRYSSMYLMFIFMALVLDVFL